jgi:hypothetical protein
MSVNPAFPVKKALADFGSLLGTDDTCYVANFANGIFDSRTYCPRPSRAHAHGGWSMTRTDAGGIAFDAQMTAGYLPDSKQAAGMGLPLVENGIGGANIILPGNYMASSFAMAADNHGGAIVVAEAPQPDDQLPPRNPQNGERPALQQWVHEALTVSRRGAGVGRGPEIGCTD